MRLVTFRTSEGQPHVGALLDNSIVDLTWLLAGRHPSLPMGFNMVDFIASGDDGMRAARIALEMARADLEAIGALAPLNEQGLFAPIPRPRKNVICLGRNYAEHAAESMRAFGQKPPDAGASAKPAYPAIFTKAPTSVIGPFDPIPFDLNITEKLDWEVELALVIGRKGINIKREEAMSYIFGYMVLNDVSARDIQPRHGGQFFKGKSLDGTCPCGPWIVTPDTVPDPDNLEVWTRVNGVIKQHDNTASMMFDVAEIIEQVSFGMTLEPGDIIATGTPAGVGHAREPAEYLRPGDVVECEVGGVGVIRNSVVKRET